MQQAQQATSNLTKQRQTLGQLMTLYNPNQSLKLKSDQTNQKYYLQIKKPSRSFYMKQTVKTLLSKISNLNMQRDIGMIDQQPELYTNDSPTLQGRYSLNNLTNKFMTQKKLQVNQLNSKGLSLQYTQIKPDNFNMTSMDSKRSIGCMTDCISPKRLGSSPKIKTKTKLVDQFMESIIDKEFHSDRMCRRQFGQSPIMTIKQPIRTVLIPQMSVQNMNFSKGQQSYIQLQSKSSIPAQTSRSQLQINRRRPELVFTFPKKISPSSAIIKRNKMYKPPQTQLKLLQIDIPSFLEREPEADYNIKQWSHQSSLNLSQ